MESYWKLMSYRSQNITGRFVDVEMDRVYHIYVLHIDC